MAQGKQQNRSRSFTDFTVTPAFPDLHVKIEHILAENNLVLVFLNLVGTHKGEFNGRSPTNKRVTNRSDRSL